MITKRVLVGLVAGLLLAAAPVASYASTGAGTETDNYVTPNGVTLDPSIVDPCGTSYVDFPAGYWVAGERIDLEVTGQYAAGTRYDTPLAAAADGSLHSEIHAPQGGVGVYNLTFRGTSRQYVGALTVTADVFDDPSCQTGQAAAVSASALAVTGGGVPVWVIGTGAGLLVAGGIVVGVGVARRRRAS